MFEMRWLVTSGKDDPEKFLQYRYQHEATDYSSKDHKTNGFLRSIIWSEWKNVPVIEENR